MPSRARSAPPSCSSSSTASNPFLRLDPPPIEGNGLNPLLQDPALAFHPPFLYAGYVGLSIAFSFAIAALIDGKVDAAWARWVRPWTLAAWMFLTIGIAMGSWWAYYELGWGGFWFWDPVENASFMPWLVGDRAAPFGGRRREAQRPEDLDHPSRHPRLLAVAGRHLPGALGRAHLGACLRRRSGARRLHPGDPLPLHRRRADALRLAGAALKAGGLFAPISREGGLVLNNLLLCTACAAVFIGTLYPLALETLTGDKISVGPPYFNLTFGLIILPLLLLVPVGPFLTWKRADVLAAMQRLWLAAAAAIGIGVLAMAIAMRGPWLAPFGVALGLWLILGALVELAERIALFKQRGIRLVALPRAAALRLRHDARPCGRRHRRHRHRRGHRLARGAASSP